MSTLKSTDGNQPKVPPIVLAWLPLALMWMMMAVEQPAIAAVVARMNHATRQLAAFGVTFSLALFIEGPVIQLLAAGTTLADCRENYKRLLGMMHLIGIAATAFQGLLCLPGVFTPFALKILAVPEPLMEPARTALLAMLPWTAAVGYRRLWQGILIRYGKTGAVPITMAVRLVTTLAVLFEGFSSNRYPGAVLGGLSLSAGVLAGAAAAWIRVFPVIRRMPSGSGHSHPLLSIRELAAFYIPLALTSFIKLGARPLMQMGMARGKMPLESLALWPVCMGYLFLYTAISLSSQEIVIARLEGETSKRTLVHFTFGLAGGLSLVYTAVWLTPLWYGWFAGVSGLSMNLTEMAYIPLAISIPLIPATAFTSLFRGSLIRTRRTGDVTIGVAINVSVLLLVLFPGVALFNLSAIQVMAAAYTLAALAEFAFLASRRPLALKAS